PRTTCHSNLVIQKTKECKPAGTRTGQWAGPDDWSQDEQLSQGRWDGKPVPSHPLNGTGRNRINGTNDMEHIYLIKV
ncbi:hypothetical protein HAX54_047148, partial [Datura stramonium]|nr:hypothetical protein [Datura stramonium]